MTSAQRVVKTAQNAQVSKVMGLSQMQQAFLRALYGRDFSL